MTKPKYPGIVIIDDCEPVANVSAETRERMRDWYERMIDDGLIQRDDRISPLKEGADLDAHLSERAIRFYVLGDKREVLECGNVASWCYWMTERAECRRVALDEIGTYRVSTVFLGCNLGTHIGELRVFETAVFGGVISIVKRYATWEEAEAGHKEVCELVEAETECENFEEETK